MQAIILVGGEGTRLRPLTLNRLKATVPLLGQPFLAYQFAWLKSYGFSQITLSLCHKSQEIKKIFGTGKKYGVKLNYALEKEPLGTAGAIRNAITTIKSKAPVVVLNGDILTAMNLKQMLLSHKRQKAVLTIALAWVKDPSRYGLVEVKAGKRVKSFLEKPSSNEKDNHWINAGVYILEPEILAEISANTNCSAEREFFPKIITQHKRVFAFPTHNYWLDIGTPAKYLQAHLDILEGKVFKLSRSKNFQYPTKVRLGKKCKIHSTANLYAPTILDQECQVAAESRIGDFSVLGKRVRVGSHVNIERAVILDDVTIAEGARLSDCIIGSGCKIGRFVNVSSGVVLGDNTIISDYSQI